MAHNHDIPLQEAIKMITLYRSEKDVILKPEYAKTGILPNCETFDKAAFDELSKVPGCASIRCYLGMDGNKDVRVIFVAVDNNGVDILPDQGGSIKEIGSRCPPICPVVGPLNPQ